MAWTDRFYDLSGSLTYLSCTAPSLALPYLRAKNSSAVTGLAEYLGCSTNGGGVEYLANRDGLHIRLSFNPLYRKPSPISSPPRHLSSPCHPPLS
ncbi:hypothetical protein CC80DRAFT_129707 [Byssothecium circinans]|uniref:Uncharacterized protein n=1 Tax=Byssothecium circinans TaxID=147558 RepID=A0A6A5TN98_9PLEO|nr:hypothetical protein CC80DRAFT_129707 [Byssothecium circinans]